MGEFSQAIGWESSPRLLDGNYLSAGFPLLSWVIGLMHAKLKVLFLFQLLWDWICTGTLPLSGILPFYISSPLPLSGILPFYISSPYLRVVWFVV